MNDWEIFLEEEKSNNTQFLRGLELSNERFDLEDYILLKSIWQDQYLIQRIYTVIDDIIKVKKLEENMRFLIIGDFLFSISSTELKDPSELFLKVTRDNYLSKIRLRANINLMFHYNWIKYVEIHKMLLIGLTNAKILTKTQVRTLSKEEWNTTIYFMLEIKEDFLIQKNVIGTSKTPFVLKDIAGSKYSVSNFRNLWKVKRKKREMEDFSLPYTSIIKANHINFILSKDTYNLSKEIIEKEKSSLLLVADCLNFEEYLLKLKKIIKDKSYTYKLLLGIEKISDIKYNDVLLLKKDVKEEYTKIISGFQKIISMELLNKDIFEKTFYLPCFMDNRGRQYYSTKISPTFSLLFRNLINFKNKKDFKNLEKSEFYQTILNYKYLVEEFGLSDQNSYVALVLFIEIGKFFMKNTKEYIITTENIIILGKKNYENLSSDLNFEELLYVKKIQSSLDNILINNVIDKNLVIFKDATASGLQNFGILSNYNEEKLHFLNLNSKDWCDTYQYLMNAYLIIEEKFRKRKYWKPTIMTIPYNATWYRCFETFKNALEKDGIIYKNFTDEEKNKLMKAHKNFYNEVKNNVKKEFYFGEVKNLKLFKYNKWITVSIHEYKINYLKKRDKYRSYIFMLNEDEEASQTALEANNMHYLDAELVKHVLQKYDIISIHDSFGMNITELHLIMDEINSYYSKIIGKKTYSIHIII